MNQHERQITVSDVQSDTFSDKTCHERQLFMLRNYLQFYRTVGTGQDMRNVQHP